jgi:hypothetical protein
MCYGNAVTTCFVFVLNVPVLHQVVYDVVAIKLNLNIDPSTSIFLLLFHLERKPR